MSNGTFVRHDIWALENAADNPPWDPVTLGYAKAIQTMQQREPDDPTSWSYQSAMHGTYRTPADPLWNGCQHGSWFFLPWHRIYIWYFEKIVRSVVIENGGTDDWALPYWNYSDGPPGSAALPPAFREAKLPDGSDNPLLVPDGNRATAINDGNPMPGIVTSTTRAMESKSFSPGFGGLPKGPVHFANPHGLLESQPHDNVHVTVGGDVTRVGCHEGWMSDPNCAASDPIFYLHHSNIDRLWEKWLAQGDGRANPTHSDWTDQEFSAFDADGQEQSKSCGTVANLANLDYVYDDMETTPEEAVPEEVAPRAPAPPGDAAPTPSGGGDLPERPGNGPEIAGGGGTELGTDKSVVQLTPAENAVPVAEAAEGVESPRVYLHLEDVDTDGTPGFVWEVRLDPDGSGGDPDEAVGAVSFFGRGHAHGADAAEQDPGVSGERFIFDITQVVCALSAAGRWDENKITVSFHPAPPEGYDDDRTPSVRVGRVYVTHG
jgi:Common central domain of tyrosinase